MFQKFRKKLIWTDYMRIMKYKAVHSFVKFGIGNRKEHTFCYKKFSFFTFLVSICGRLSVIIKY